MYSFNLFVLLNACKLYNLPLPLNDLPDDCNFASAQHQSCTLGLFVKEVAIWCPEAFILSPVTTDTTLYGLIWPMHKILSISNTDPQPSKQLRYESMILGVQASFVHTFGSGNQDNITDTPNSNSKTLMCTDHPSLTPVTTLD